jgi:hypothetical protein
MLIGEMPDICYFLKLGAYSMVRARKMPNMVQLSVIMNDIQAWSQMK